ncbi:MAG: hypothetical protein HC802_19845 [Caldilineaceae bacterium]|nr:hypothetical protein [Caldilineaceae bacterium]
MIFILGVFKVTLEQPRFEYTPSLCGVAGLWASEAESLEGETVGDTLRRAAELSSYVANHPGTWHEYKVIAARLQRSIVARIPADAQSDLPFIRATDHPDGVAETVLADLLSGNRT